MASTRIGYAGTIAASDPITAANNNLLPNGVIGYDLLTSNQGSITTSTTLSGLTVSPTIGSNRFISVTVAGAMQANAANGTFQVVILEDTVAVQLRRFVTSDANTSFDYEVVWYHNNPSAGAHAYAVSVGPSASDANTWTHAAGAAAPAWIVVRDEGPRF